MQLTSENIHNILMDCLFSDGEDTTNHIDAEGVRLKVGLHPERLNKHKAEIEEMIEQLPDKFKKDVAGGSSFLNACLNESGHQWSEHSDIDKLLCLGLAIGKISYLLPREQWNMLPGGMPYFVIS